MKLSLFLDNKTLKYLEWANVMRHSKPQQYESEDASGKNVFAPMSTTIVSLLYYAEQASQLAATS
jgi:hypothetical protein